MGREKMDKGNKLTDISTNAGENVPPAVKFEEERPGHANGALGGCEEAADGLVDAPDCEAESEAY